VYKLYRDTTEAVFTEEKHGVWDPMLELTRIHFISELERSLLLVEDIFICMFISKTTNRKRENTEKGDGRGETES